MMLECFEYKGYKVTLYTIDGFDDECKYVVNIRDKYYDVIEQYFEDRPKTEFLFNIVLQLKRNDRDKKLKELGI